MEALGCWLVTVGMNRVISVQQCGGEIIEILEGGQEL